MELWIRSQNKERLIKCKELDIFDRNEMTFVKEKLKDEKLEVMIIADEKVNLGTYKTKERALEILDDIKKHLMPKAIMQQVKLDEYELKLLPEIYVYEMPGE